MRGTMHCPCAACGKAESTSGCVRGFTCVCARTSHLGIAETCQRCFCCREHCTCEAGYVDDAMWKAMTREQKIALATEGQALRETLRRQGRIYR